MVLQGIEEGWNMVLQENKLIKQQRLEDNKEHILSERMWLAKVKNPSAWLIDIRKLELEKRMKYVKDPPTNMTNAQLQDWNAILMSCQDEFK